MGIKKSKLIPVLLLAFLMLAIIIRWDYKTSKTYSDYVVKWKKDRWTGQMWMEVYDRRGVIDIPSDRNQNAWNERLDYYESWKTLVVIDIIWIVFVFKIKPWLNKKYPREIHQQSDKF